MPPRPSRPPAAPAVLWLRNTHGAHNRPPWTGKRLRSGEKRQVRALITGAPPGTRTPNPRIKSRWATDAKRGKGLARVRQRDGGAHRLIVWWRRTVDAPVSANCGRGNGRQPFA